MRKSYKAILFASTLALGLGLGSCSKSDGNEPNPSPVNPTTSPQLISASEAQVNNKSISILRSAAEQKLKVKQISTLAGGTGGYNVLLSDERLVQIYIAGTARSLRQGTSSNTEQNPVAAVDFAQKGKAIFTLLDKSKIELDRTDTNESGALAAAQSVAPESKFLFTLFLGDEHQLIKTHSKVKAIEITKNGRLEYRSIFNTEGYYTKFEDLAYNRDGSADPLRNRTFIFDWSGERLINVEYIDRDPEDSSVSVEVHKLSFNYNQLNQAIIKSLTENGIENKVEVTYNLGERTVVSTSDNSTSKSIYTYNEYYFLTKKEHYHLRDTGEWVVSYPTTYKYNSQGDLLEEVSTASSGTTFTSRYTYEYDSKGNWIKRTETSSRSDSTDIDTHVVTREITY